MLAFWSVRTAPSHGLHRFHPASVNAAMHSPPISGGGFCASNPDPDINRAASREGVNVGQELAASTMVETSAAGTGSAARGPGMAVAGFGGSDPGHGGHGHAAAHDKLAAPRAKQGTDRT